MTKTQLKIALVMVSLLAIVLLVKLGNVNSNSNASSNVNTQSSDNNKDNDKGDDHDNNKDSFLNRMVKSDEEVLNENSSMVTVPTNGSAGITFPMNDNNYNDMDDSSGTIKHRFAMAKTEVTYELWKKVYDWATDSNRGAKKYRFANLGREGSEGVPGAIASATKEKQPVTEVSWRDAIVWSNAYTEWYNANEGGSLTVVYKDSSGNVLRNANQTVESYVGDTFDPTINTANGFRLPTRQEWSYAARLRTNATNSVVNGKPDLSASYPINIDGINYWFTKGDSVSGADKNYRYGFQGFAWFDPISEGSTKPVGVLLPNVLGIHDMSGNVWELCFDRYDNEYSDRVGRGGSWGDDANVLPVGYVGSFSPDYTGGGLGFRLARSLP